MKRRLAIVFALLLSLLMASLGWLGASESGLHWAYRQLLTRLPGELETGHVGGRLFGPILLRDIRYRDTSGTYEADDLVFDWNPWALFQTRLAIERIESSGLGVMLEPAPPAAAAAEALEIPAIAVPLEVSIRQIVLEDARLVRQGQTTEIQRIEASLRLRGERLGIERFSLRSGPLRLGFGGSLRIVPELDHELNFEWQTTLPSAARLTGSGRLSGNLRQTRLRHRLDGAAQADLGLELETPLQQLRWRGELDLEAFDAARIDPALPLLQGSLRLSAAGDLQGASADGNLNLQQTPYGPLQTRFRLGRVELEQDAQGLTFSALALDLFDGVIGADGSFAWRPQTRWQARITTRGVDPGTIRADWPGRIDAEFGIDGELQAAGPAVSLDIKSLSGELRDYPVALRGTAQWRDNQASLAGIELTSGNSRVLLDGSLGETFDLEWSLHSDDLAELYPGTQGRVAAEGRLDGRLERAKIAAELQGQGLAYAEFSAAMLDGAVALELDLSRAPDIDFHRTQVDLDARELVLRQQQLRRASLQTDGRRITAEVEAAEGDASVELAGEFEGNRWRGRLVEARLQNPDYGSWRLLAPANLVASPGAIELAGACLDNPRSGKLCIDLNHVENAGTLSFDLRGVPLALARPWLPAGISADGSANANGNLDYDLPRRLHGNVEIDFPRGRVGYELAPGEPQVVEFERARVQSRISSSGITARVDAALGQDDAVEGSIELPGADLLAFDIDAQPVRARLNARLGQLGLVDAALPQIERLRGSAEVNLEIEGRIGKPLVSGNMHLRDGSLYLPDLELEIEQVQLDAQSAGPDRLDYRLQAEVAGGQLAATGSTALGADAGWASRLSLTGRQLVLAPLLQRRLPEDLTVAGRLDFDAKADLRLPDQLSGKVEIRLPSGTIGYPLPNGEAGSWTYRDIGLDGRLENRSLDLRGGFGIGDNRLRAELRLARFDPFRLDPQAQALDGRVEIELDDLSLTESLLPDVQRTSGSLRVKLALGGTLARPQLRGDAEVRDAGLQIARLGLNLEQINLTANSDAEGMTRFAGSLRSGEGGIEFDGAVRLDPGAGWPGSLAIRGEDFEVAQIPDARVSLSPRLDIRLANRNVDITGEVLVPYARLQPRDITTAARVSGDTVIIGEEQDPGGRWQINSKVRLILGERVTFFGYGFDGRLGGSLLIEESPGKPTRGSGEITILEGRYRAYGQYLDVEEGRLLYSGGPLTNPGLDLRAVRKTGDVVAGIDVSGRLSNPRVDLFSSPAMGQTDTLSYLLTGGPLDSATSGEGAMMANAALALGLSGGDRIARSIGDRFGIDEMRIESSSGGDQASLVVGRYLSPRIYVGYGVGLIESINTLNLRYRITERWQLEAESGAQQAADLFYRFER